VGIGSVFAGIIVPVLTDGRMGSQSLQPLFIVLMQSVLVVVYRKNTVAARRRGCLSRLELG
jgi:hypothetical protein